MNVELVVLDVDGTLLRTDHVLSNGNRDAIVEARAHGIDVMLATSRGPAALVSVLRSLEMYDPDVFVASQGAVTGSLDRSGALRVASRQSAPLDSAKELVRRALTVGLSAHWFSRMDWFVTHVDETVEAEIAAVDAVPEVRDLLAETTEPDKIMLIATTAQMGALAQVASDIPEGLVAQHSHPNFLEVTRADVNKGMAVRSYCRSQGIDPGTVAAMGDGLNDLALFDAVGLTVAPANARPEVLRAADLRAPRNDDDGVAWLLDRIMRSRYTIDRQRQLGPPEPREEARSDG